MKHMAGVGAVLAMVFLLTAAAAAPAAAPVGGGVPASVQYIGHDKVATVMAKGGEIVNDPGLIVLAQRRGSGPVEYHEHTNHIFMMVDGEATFITGGKMVGAKRTNPEQMVADAIEGGETHHLSKGDVITIPAKTPHWWKEVTTKTVGYYAVNIESQ